jgi:hypothetical protein
MVFVTMNVPPDETAMNPTMTILASTDSAHATMGGLVLLDQWVLGVCYLRSCMGLYAASRPQQL